MLGKLVRYEFKATAHTILPTFLALGLFTILGRFSLGHLIVSNAASTVVTANGIHISTQTNDLWSTLSNLAMVFYVLCIVAISVVIAVVIIQRFYKNLTGDEGYLMHTLPVKPGLLIGSKLIVATVWQLVMGLCGILSVWLLLYQSAVINLVGTKFAEGWQVFTAHFRITPLWIGVIILVTVLSAMGNTLMIYASVAIGHTTKNHRVLGAVLAYFGLSTASSVIVTPLVGLLFAPSVVALDRNPAGAVALVGQLFNRSMLLAGVVSLIMIVVYFFVTNYVFTKQLNLE